MKYLATREELKEIDRFSMEELGTLSAVLMERAALSICNETSNFLGEEKAKILVVCGSGNNGGDAAAAARMLSEKGYDVKVLIVATTGKSQEEDSAGVSKPVMSGMMRLQVKILNRLNVTVGYLHEDCNISFVNDVSDRISSEPLMQWISWSSLIIDGLFGIGLSRPVEGVYKELIEKINEAEARVIAADIPSGINANSGEVMGTAVKADMTVTFGAMKKGLIFYPGNMYAGEVLLRDCGFPKKALENANIKSHIVEPLDMKDFPKRKMHSNKGSYGRVLVIAGSRAMAGAAWLSATAAYRCGAGLVKIFTDACNETALKSLMPEAQFEFYDEDSLCIPQEKMLKWADVIVVGPGMSQTPLAGSVVRTTLKYARDEYMNGRVCPLILDADGINLAAKWTEGERKELILNNPHIILTPHIKEMANFIGEDIEYVQQNAYKAETLLPDLKGTLVLKDDRTVICHSGESFVNTRGCNGMATGGSGDVLAGILAGILAQRIKSERPLPSGDYDSKQDEKQFFDWTENQIFKDAALGVILHGLAGEDAAKRKGNAGMLAGDLLDGIANVLRVSTDLP